MTPHGINIKIVPDAEPNADGEWIEVAFNLPVTTSWRKTDEYLSPFVPEGFHLVAVGGRTYNPDRGRFAELEL